MKAIIVIRNGCVEQVYAEEEMDIEIIDYNDPNNSEKLENAIERKVLSGSLNESGEKESLLDYPEQVNIEELIDEEINEKTEGMIEVF